MATIGHLAAGFATSRLVGPLDGGRDATWDETLVITLAAEAPDVDLLVPVPRRGMRHSIGMAAAAANGTELATPGGSLQAAGSWQGPPRWRSSVYGLGCADSGPRERTDPRPPRTGPVILVGEHALGQDGLPHRRGDIDFKHRVKLRPGDAGKWAHCCVAVA